ncbi:MAG: 6-phosphofructokinase [Oscillospiraceae bacterium]|nr:6-phosphofructokinase [Oscillospiraceae bacterium]MCH5208932.1 6-phosphofructokinase [Oscillospiraceae bacterium]
MEKKIGVLTSGGDAPGMNAAVRAVTRTAIYKGFKVIGIRRGYNGLLNRDMVELKVRDVSDIIQRGGTAIFTARCPEFKEWANVEKAAKICKEENMQGVVVIGGDGSFRGAADLSKAGVPCVGLPGTIDNDIQCSEYTIGYDTAMNTVMQMVDKLRDTSHSHDRCAVVEVMGRHAGHIALSTGLACGATFVLVPEVKWDIRGVIDKILEERGTGKKQFIIVVAEGVGNTNEIAKLIETGTGIESRATILGHVQRGGSPTVRDRVVAAEMGYYAVELLEKGIGNRVVGLKDGKVYDVDIQDALSMKKPFNERRYKICNEINF